MKSNGHIQVTDVTSTSPKSHVQSMKPLPTPSRRARLQRRIVRPHDLLKYLRWLPQLPNWLRFSDRRATVVAAIYLATVTLILNAAVLA